MNSINSASNNGLQTGLNGFQASVEKAARSANELASGYRGAGYPGGLHTTAVELMSATLQTNASAEVIETAIKQDRILGSIIDTYA